MRNRELVLILCLGGSLLGCSSKPSESDIAAGVSAFWAGCVKVSDVKKTNGAENGNTYHVNYTYKIEVPEDGVGMFGPPPKCSFDILNPKQGQAIALMQINGNQGAIKKGDVYTVTGETDMVKSEKGWIFQ